MNTNTYNGWTNYATWRVALEWFDTHNPFSYEKDSYELSKMLKEYVNESLEMEACGDFTLAYALAFVSEVNWFEIAQHLIEEEVTNG